MKNIKASLLVGLIAFTFGAHAGGYLNLNNIEKLPIKNSQYLSLNFGEISPRTGRPATNYVNGYFRSNGTYVNGYWRS